MYITCAIISCKQCIYIYIYMQYTATAITLVLCLQHDIDNNSELFFVYGKQDDLVRVASSLCLIPVRVLQ